MREWTMSNLSKLVLWVIIVVHVTPTRSWEISACTRQKFELFSYFLNSEYARLRGNTTQQDNAIKEIMTFVVDGYVQCDPCDTCLECAQYRKNAWECIQKTIFDRLQQSVSDIIKGQIKSNIEKVSKEWTQYFEAKMFMEPQCFCEECDNQCDMVYYWD